MVLYIFLKLKFVKERLENRYWFGRENWFINIFYSFILYFLILGYYKDD